MKYKCSKCKRVWSRTLCIYPYVHCPKCGNSMKERNARFGDIK